MITPIENSIVITAGRLAEARLRVNVRCMLNEPSEAEDRTVPGLYEVTLDIVHAQPNVKKIASMVLDVFHATIAIACLDDFEITALDTDDNVVGEEASYPVNYADQVKAKAGHVEKISELPIYVPAIDAGLSADQLDDKYSPDGDGEHPVHTRADWRLDVSHENTVRGYWDWVAGMLEQAEDDSNMEATESLLAQAGDHSTTSIINPPKDALSKTTEGEYFPGVVVKEVGSVRMGDIVGEYNVPDEVPEWIWVEKAACFSHTHNGTDDIWEFAINIDCPLELIPTKLKPVFDEAWEKGLSYLIFHQDT